MPLAIAKILFPTDFSPMSLHALPYAKEFAATFDARLHCLHVVDEAYTYWTAMGPEAVPIGITAEDLVTIAERHMKDFAADHLAGLKTPVLTRVIMGVPFRDICVYARDHVIDLIILATHGRSALKAMLMGNTAEKVVRKAPCPVLTVRHPEHEFVMP